MIRELSVPSKTFLVGEYIALSGESCLVLNTEPRFTLQITDSPQPEGIIEGISPESPAGRFLISHSEIFKGRHLRFTDPHQGMGGLGASSAQFALCYVLYKSLQNPEFQPYLREEPVADLLDQYLNVAWSGQGVPPSGADLISQLFLNHIGHWRRKDFHAGSLNWPFHGHGFFLARTGIKKATHLHLSTLENFADQGLIAAAEAVKESLSTGDLSRFIEGIEAYRRELNANGLTCQETVELLTSLDEMKEVTTAKGCGALGADILFVLFPMDKKSALADKFQSLGLKVVGSHDHLAQGFMARDIKPTSANWEH